jgi:hypothetical protein
MLVCPAVIIANFRLRIRISGSGSGKRAKEGCSRVQSRDGINAVWSIATPTGLHMFRSGARSGSWGLILNTGEAVYRSYKR